MNKLVILLFLPLLVTLSVYGADMGDIKPKIAVVDFKYEITGENSKFNSAMITDQLASELVESGRFTVLERAQIEAVLKEKNFKQTFQVLLEGKDYDFKELGKLLEAQAIVTGTVYYGEREVTRYRNGGYSFSQLYLGLLFPPLLLIPPSGGEPYQERVSAYSVTVRAIDVETGKVIASEDLLESDLANLGFMVKRFYIELLEYYEMRGEVVDADKDKVYVNLGSNGGVVRGDIFEVYRPGKSLAMDGQEIIKLPEEKIGEVEVVNVADKAAICEILPHLTKGAVEKGYAAKLIPVDTLQTIDLARRRPKDNTRPEGLGNAFIGQTVGSELVKYNPAGLGQISIPEISLAWKMHSNSSSFWMPNAGESYSGLRDTYGSFVENIIYPSEFNGIVPLKNAAFGIHVDVDDMRINQEVFKLDNGGLNLGIYGGTTIASNIFAGGGLGWTDKWAGVHRILNSADYSYQFRGNTLFFKGGVLMRPSDNLGIGGVVDLGKNYAGTLKATGSSPSESSFSYDYPSSLGLGVSYKPLERLVLNLDLLTYFNPAWYDARAGIEYSLTKNLALRTGTYNKLIRMPNFASDPNYPSHYDLRSNVYTMGIGYTQDAFFMDIAGEYEILKDADIIVYPDFNAGSQQRTLLSSYKEARIILSIGMKIL